MSIPAQLQCHNVTCMANQTLDLTKSNAEACTAKVGEMAVVEGNGGLYNGMIAPHINTTITGWLWYQVSMIRVAV
jgi:hypothetical protein